MESDDVDKEHRPSHRKKPCQEIAQGTMLIFRHDHIATLIHGFVRRSDCKTTSR